MFLHWLKPFKAAKCNHEISLQLQKNTLNQFKTRKLPYNSSLLLGYYLNQFILTLKTFNSIDRPIYKCNLNLRSFNALPAMLITASVMIRIVCL